MGKGQSQTFLHGYILKLLEVSVLGGGASESNQQQSQAIVEHNSETTLLGAWSRGGKTETSEKFKSRSFTASRYTSFAAFSCSLFLVATKQRRRRLQSAGTFSLPPPPQKNYLHKKAPEELFSG